MVFGAVFGGVIASACVTSPSTTTCDAGSCLGTDNTYYGPCPSGLYCSTGCGSPSAGGVRCCGGGSTPNTPANYYVSASGCTMGQSGYSYQGSDSNTCYTYYNAAIAGRCTKILWKCS